MSQSGSEPGAVIVTGASTGIGEACACRLERLGYTVFAGIRKAADGAALQAKCSDRLRPLILDVTDPPSIERAAETVSKFLGDKGLAGLVNNAGIAVAAPLEYLPPAELRRQFEVNVVGQLAVTQAFMPLLRKSQGRIINMSSVSGLTALPMTGAYASSKFALEGLSDALRRELAPFHIPVILIEPAGIATPIWDKSAGDFDNMAGRLPGGWEEDYRLVGEVTRKFARHAAKHGLSVELVADAVAEALTSPKPKARYVVAKTPAMVKLLRILPAAWQDRLILNRLHKAARQISSKNNS
jgi:NAD(P)-dependent dehydrogenase (short-subunit alcohol dehydrogenase family)